MRKWTEYNGLLFGLILLLTNLAGAQSEHKIILLGLSVAGAKQADSGLILATSGLVVGQELTGEKIQQAIRQLWDLHLFADVKVIAEMVTPEGAYLRIQVQEFPRLEYIDIGSTKKIDRQEIEKAIDLFPGQVLMPSETVRLRRKLEKLAEEKGYLLAKVAVEIRDGSSEDRKTLYVRVEEGQKVKIKDISFTGNTVFTDGRLCRQLNNTHERFLIFIRSGVFHRDKFEEDLSGLVDFYREHGYRDARVLGDSIWYSESRKRMFIDIRVEEGSRYYFGDVSFSGSNLIPEEELRRQLLFRPGEYFNQKKYDVSIRERLGSLFYDCGYIYANIHSREVPVGGDTLDVEINIDPGNQFSVRNIHITGNTKTREKVIRREFSLKPGDTFDVSKLRRSIRDVVILNFFADVQPDVEDVSDSEVDLWVKVQEKPTDQANVSAGYSEQDGLIGAFGFSAPNLFGRGQRLSFDWNFGQQYGSFSVSFTEPWLFDTETLVGTSLYHTRRRWSQGFTETLLGGSLRFGRRFLWPDDYFRGDWIYRLEQSRYNDFSASFQAREDKSIIEGEKRISSSVTQIITRDSRNFPEFPTAGSVASLTTELAGGPLTGDNAYHKHIFSLEWYTSFHPKLVLYNQFLSGYMAGLTGNPKDIPLLEYFYMGGAGLSLGTPLRGYDERTVGPYLSSSTTADGGKAQLKTSVELRVQMVDNPTIYGLGFAEAGNTWRSFIEVDPFDLKRSVGLGVRLYMPLIGLIGIDYGYGLDYFDANGRRHGQWRPHFQFGRQF